MRRTRTTATSTAKSTARTATDRDLVNELLHALALGPAAIGTCCLAADRRRVRAPELAASVLMLLSMLDATFAQLLAPVFWAAFLLIGAMVLAAIRRQRGNTERSIRSGTGMTVHTAIGMVAMAVLLLAMGHTEVTLAPHAHGLDSASLVAALLTGTLGYVAASLVAAVREREWRERTQHLTMATSTLIMGLALIS